MTIRIAINGYGRIGRNILRASYQDVFREKIQVVAINDLASLEAAAHLTQYDSVHSGFSSPVSFTENSLFIDSDKIPYFSESDPAKLPWKALNVDLVCECTGRFTQRSQAQAHLQAGAQKVLISAPCAEADATIVYGVNHLQLKREHSILSNASCTTNCLAPIVKVLNDKIGIASGNMTTIHAYTNDQFLTDELNSDLYRARAATLSMIPTQTGAASAIASVLPELEGKLKGMAIRIPTVNVSMIDFHFVALRSTSIEEINALLKSAAQGELQGVLAYNEVPLVSIDFNHNPASAIFDSKLTEVNGTLCKVMAWYDNEWGFSNRMLDTALAAVLAQ